MFWSSCFSSNLRLFHGLLIFSRLGFNFLYFIIYFPRHLARYHLLLFSAPEGKAIVRSDGSLGCKKPIRSSRSNTFGNLFKFWFKIWMLVQFFYLNRSLAAVMFEKMQKKCEKLALMFGVWPQLHVCITSHLFCGLEFKFLFFHYFFRRLWWRIWRTR